MGGTFLGELLAGLAQMHDIRVAPLWIPGPLLLGWLLISPRSAWPLCVLATCTGCALAFLALAPLVTVPRLLARLAEFAMVVPVALLLSRWQASRVPLQSYRDIILFLVLGCLLLPACIAWWQTLLPVVEPDTTVTGRFSALVLYKAVSYLLIVPIAVNVTSLLRLPERRLGWSWHKVGVALMLLGALGVVWSVDWRESMLTPLLAFAPIPLLVGVLIVFGVAGASIGMLLVGVLVMQLSLLGLGPFGSWEDVRNLITAQIWLLGTGAALLFLCALAEQRLSSHLSLQHANRRLGEVTGRMLVVQEEERTRIARDLHDDVNQSLAAISIRLSALRQRLPHADQPSVIELQDQLLLVSNDIRAISHELHPSILRFTGLASALDAFCIKRNARGALRLNCYIDDPPRLRDEHELSLFRIVQEAINNVDKHAEASLVRLRVGAQGREMVVLVDDDGVGMPCGRHVTPTPGLGMISMEERARLLGGSLLVTRSPFGGTRVEVRFPLSVAVLPARSA